MFRITLNLISTKHGFTKSKSTVTNLVTFLDVLTIVVHGQRQADAVYFHLSNAFDLVPHNMWHYATSQKVAGSLPD
jgi:hypothetical protein